MKNALVTSLVCALAIAVLQAAPRPFESLSVVPSDVEGRQRSGQAPLTPEQTLDRRAIGELDFSPDGSRLVFTVTDPPKGSSRARALWLLDTGSGRLRQLTFSGKSDGAPRWSPDGASIAFTSDRDGAPQLYRLSLGGGEAEKLTDRKEAVGAFRWSPDGKSLALLMNDPKGEAQEKREKDKDDSRVVDKDDRHARVWILDVETKALKPLTSGRWRIRQIEWVPPAALRLRSGQALNGPRIENGLVAIATAKPEVDQWTDRLYTINVGSGDFNEIAAPRGPIGGFTLSPDGSTLAYIGARVDGPEAHDLYLQPMTGGAPQNLTATTIDRPIAQPRWIDNRSIAANITRGFKSALAIIGRDGKTTAIDGIEVTGVNPSAFTRSSTGTLAFVGETTTRAPELWMKSPNAPARSVTAFNEKWASIPLVAPQFVKYRGADGVEIEAALLEPSALSSQPSAMSRQLFPLVVLVHGGPTGRWADTFEPWGQLLAARGYAVLYPNVRGSTGYGQRFVEMNRADWGGGDFRDVMAAVDAMIARGVADPGQLGIGGWSYGGYMAAWAVTQTTRFKAAVSGAPMSDLASEFGTEDSSAYDEWFYGTPYEKLDGFIKSSPITYVRNARTPTLLLQGDDDLTDPIGQSQQFYRGLKRYGVESDFVRYPREGHGLREEKHLLDRLTRIIAWYDKYLKPTQRPTSQ
jgi:dipeptidyl aminopeptidase/acylaminoacyl peptidase